MSKMKKTVCLFLCALMLMGVFQLAYRNTASAADFGVRIEAGDITDGVLPVSIYFTGSHYVNGGEFDFNYDPAVFSVKKFVNGAPEIEWEKTDKSGIVQIYFGFLSCCEEDTMKLCEIHLEVRKKSVSSATFSFSGWYGYEEIDDEFAIKGSKTILLSQQEEPSTYEEPSSEEATTDYPSTSHTHTYATTYTVDKKATCTTAGSKSRHCTVCGAKGYVTTIPAKGHVISKTVTKATFSDNGSVVKKCSVCKKTISKTVYYKIKTVKLSKTKYFINGKVQKPKVTVKDSKGKAISSDYYTVTYSNKNSKAVGTYTVTVKFKGVYSGSKTLKYKITAPAKVTGIKQFVEKGISFRWDKVSGADGYEVYISPASESNYKKVATQTSNILKNPKINSSIKVKVRAYVTVDGKKVYGEFSKIVKMSPVK